MDRDAAFRHLREYCALIIQAQSQSVISKERRATMKAVNEHLPGVNYYLRAIVPDPKLISAYYLGDHVSALPLVRRAIDLLTDSEEMTAHHWTGGGPALPLTMLDPVVSGVALPLWNAGKYRQAVSDAATSLNSFAQAGSAATTSPTRI